MNVNILGTMTCENDTLFLDMEERESIKLLGVVQTLAIPIPIHDLPQQADGTAPILKTPDGTIELFWNVLLYFDEHLWNSELMLKHPQAFHALFELFETFDHSCAPLLENNILGTRTISTSRMTALLQWCFLSVTKRKLIAQEAKRKHLEIDNASRQDALSELQLLRQKSNELPPLHQRIFHGAVLAVLSENYS